MAHKKQEKTEEQSAQRLRNIADIPFRFRPRAERLIEQAKQMEAHECSAEYAALKLQDLMASFFDLEDKSQIEDAFTQLEEMFNKPNFSIDAFVLLDIAPNVKESKKPGTHLSIFNALFENPKFGEEFITTETKRNLNHIINTVMDDIALAQKYLKIILQSPKLTPKLLGDISWITTIDEEVPTGLFVDLLRNPKTEDKEYLEKAIKLVTHVLQHSDYSKVEISSIVNSPLVTKEILDYLQTRVESMVGAAAELYLLPIAELVQKARYPGLDFSSEDVLFGIKLFSDMIDESRMAVTSSFEDICRNLERFSGSRALSPEALVALKRVSEIVGTEISWIMRVLAKAITAEEGIQYKKKPDLAYQALIFFNDGKDMAKELGADHEDPEICMNFAYAIVTIGSDKARKLNKELGIEYFMRYDIKTLETVLSNISDNDSKKPIWLVLYNKNDDNGAFYNSGRKLSELTKYYRLIITENENEDEFYASIKKVGTNYGRIDGGRTIGGHGTPDHVSLGKAKYSERQNLSEKEIKALEEEKTIDLTDHDELEKVAQFFGDSALLLMESCSTGKKIAKIVARAWNVPEELLHAPLIDTSIKEYVKDDKGKVVDVIYFDEIMPLSEEEEDKKKITPKRVQ